MYWYGLAQRLSSGEWLYEAFHLHDEAPHGVVAHFQREFRNANDEVRRSEWTPTAGPIHVVPAVEQLIGRYYQRLALEEDDADDAV